MTVRKRPGIAPITIGLVAIVLTAQYFFTNWAHKRIVRNFESAKIEGIVRYVGLATKAYALEIQGRSDEYLFHTRWNRTYPFEDFVYEAKVGDSVFKSPYGDTLYLFRRGSPLHYAYPLEHEDEYGGRPPVK